jgi:hypothetical protein
MNRANVLGADKQVVEYQLAMKKAEYANAIKSGQIFSDLKKIFLEMKDLQLKLHHFHGAPLTEIRNAS